MFYYLSSPSLPLSIAHFVLLVETLAKGLITLALLGADVIFVQQALDLAREVEMVAHRLDYGSLLDLPPFLPQLRFFLPFYIRVSCPSATNTKMVYIIIKKLSRKRRGLTSLICSPSHQGDQWAVFPELEGT